MYIGSIDQPRKYNLAPGAQLAGHSERKVNLFLSVLHNGFRSRKTILYVGFS
jgi:hypothetical protein